jgi:hypothetical protein
LGKRKDRVTAGGIRFSGTGGTHMRNLTFIVIAGLLFGSQSVVALAFGMGRFRFGI